jgi:ERF superfamily
MENQQVDDPKRSRTLDTSSANPELFAALATAQGQVQTVEKDGFNNERRYKYATGEAMIRASRTPLSANGLAFFYSWERVPLDVVEGDTGKGDIGNQFVCANVRMHFVLSHKGGGVIRGTAELDAIASRARTPDKAVAATLTYMHGFVIRGLLGLDREDEDDDAVDRRSDEGGWTRGPQRQPQHRSSQREDPRAAQPRTNGRPTDKGRSKPEAAAEAGARKPAATNGKPAAKADAATVAARKAMADAAKRYDSVAEACGVKPRPWLDIASEAIGRKWIAGDPHPMADYEAALQAYLTEIADLEASAGVDASYDQRVPDEDAVYDR